MATCHSLLKRVFSSSVLLCSSKSLRKCGNHNFSTVGQVGIPIARLESNFKNGKINNLKRYNISCCNFSCSSLKSEHLHIFNKKYNHHVAHTSHNRFLWNVFKRKDFGSYAKISHMGEVSEPYPIPDYIDLPPYALTGEPTPGPTNPEIKTEEMIEGMRDACKLARTILNIVGENIKVGMTTDDIDFLVHTSVVERGAYPSPLNYRGFPKSVCTSVNNVACHGIPDDRPLDDGDVISVDVTVFYNGFHGDCCETFLIGEVDPDGVHLVNAARKCRDEAIKICAPGVYFSDIGNMIMAVAGREMVTVVPAFIGHGIGSYFHGPPDIYHNLNHYPGKMKSGMTFTIEPIVAQGEEDAAILEDGWTAVMLDDGRAAQFEHTILITDDGHDILTKYF